MNENVPWTFEQKADDLSDLSAHGDRPLNNVLFLTDKTCRPNNALVQFYGQILRAYPKMLVQKDQIPPVIHPWQRSPKPLPLPPPNCITLVRMWQNHAEGAERLVIDSIRHEIGRLLDEVRPILSSMCNWKQALTTSMRAASY